MMKRNNETVSIKLGEVNVTVREANNKYSIIELTSKENGYKTIAKLQPYQCIAIMKAIDLARCVNVDFRENIKGVVAKHREYSWIHEEESGFSYKYFKCSNATISVVGIAGHCIISIYDAEINKYYRTVSFKVEDYSERLQTFRDRVNNMTFNCI